VRGDARGVRSYGQYCPIARGAEVFATRWTPLIVRNLLIGCRTFGELCDGAPGIPRTLLSQRLQELERRGLVRRTPLPGRRGYAYELTDGGRDLAPVCQALGDWAERWVELAPEHVDPYVVLWSLCRALETLEPPEQRVTIRFDLPEQPATHRRFWLVVQAPGPELCVRPPGFAEDLVISTDADWLARWRLGRVSLGQGQRCGRVDVTGPRRLVRALEEWAETTRVGLV
jgi:DNA-binding HxlR family transcriptional regulator